MLKFSVIKVKVYYVDTSHGIVSQILVLWHSDAGINATAVS